LPGSTIDKALLRRSVLARRDGTDAVDRAESSRRITDQLLKLPSFDLAATVLAYLSFGSEFDTSAFVATILAQGKRLVLPRVNKKLRGLELFSVTDLTRDVVPGVWGIREPNPDRCKPAAAGQIGLILAPGVAFTSHCERLGYGGGFYDRLLSEWSGRRPTVVAAAFKLQIVDALPIDPTDIPVDLVVTEDAIYERPA
jgi:5,10-methenyltetrahydrofolate synthetase